MQRKISRFVINYLEYFMMAAIVLGGLGYYFTPERDYGISLPSKSEFIFTVNITSRKRLEISTKAKKVGLYLNYQNIYSCPYYTDRADLIGPEINRLAQFMRSFGSPVIFYSTIEDPSPIISTVKISEADNFLNETSPNLIEKCLMSDYDSHPSLPSHEIHHSILYSSQYDFFVKDHTDLVRLAIDQKLQYVIVGGMKCNYWVPSLFHQLKSNGIEPVFIYDLSDVDYWRETQKSKGLNTHVDALRFFWKWLFKHGYKTINHFEILDRQPPAMPKGADVNFDRNREAYYFDDYFHPDFY